MTRAVIFDLDGTLIDSAPDIHAAANKVMARHGLAPFTQQEARGFVGHGAGIFIERCLAARNAGDRPGLQAQALSDFLEIYETAFDHTVTYSGVTEALENLIEQGLVLGLCTNKPESPARAVLRHLDLARFFPVIIGGDSLSQRKPDPAPLHAAISASGARDAVFVGDSEVDAETSHRAGIPFALFTEGYRKIPVEELTHRVAFSDFAHLPDITRTILG
ncbi:phosphoglycolate phosphatase [Roseovarius aestuariivivens]|uniref:phosphoglycolate phosphatase n=1 Tax=Roseovarius aestuariivivens TaxID=1888910 RepID=UPI001080B9B4|nr:phosphoglycolate phosphatase [Roseovarius aestuariivivens]